MDYQALLFDPIYAVQGVPATITLADGSVTFDGFTVLDKTAGVNVGDSIEVPTIKPAACIRMAELAANGILLAQIRDGTLTMNGAAWTISNYKPKPSPKGENDGEAFLILSGRVPLDSE